MASAMIGGILSSGLAAATDIIASRRSQDKLDALKARYGICVTRDNRELARESGLIILAVKPYMYEAVVEEIRESIEENTILVSIAAGQTIASIEAMFGKPVHLVRSMPNTPALAGEAMSAITPNSNIAEEELEYTRSIFESFGRCQVVPENMMETVIGVSGSSPAYVYLFIEAMADAAVAGGMPRKQAYEFAAQAVLGAAKMVLDTGLHPGELKDMVCSPGGTTIAAVAELEKKGFRGIVMEGMEACIRKAEEMKP